MSAGHGHDFEMRIHFHGVELSDRDFDLTRLHDWVAWQILLAANTRCGDKAAALELLRGAAGEIVGSAARTFAETFRKEAAAKARRKR